MKLKVSKTAIDKMFNKYYRDNASKESVLKYIQYNIDNLTKCQKDSCNIHFCDESAQLYWESALKELLKAKKKNIKFTKRIKFLVAVCVKANIKHLQELVSLHGKHNTNINVYKAWNHITFNNGELLFSSCGGGYEAYYLNIYNNLYEFIEILFSQIDVSNEPNIQEIKTGLTKQIKKFLA